MKYVKFTFQSSNSKNQTVLKKLFIAHPKSVNETYFEHLVHAMGFSLRMMTGGLACLIHGVLPFLFVATGSRAINDLHDLMVNKRRRAPKASQRGNPGNQSRGERRSWR